MTSIRFTNVKEFEVALDKFADDIGATTDQVVRKIGFDLFRGVISRTPVDTGWARSSWNVSFNTIDLSIPPRPSGASGDAAAKSVNAAQSAKLFTPSMTKYPVVWISNALPYIVPLENGHSKQAGKGFMVQRTFADVTANLENLLRDYEKI